MSGGKVLSGRAPKKFSRVGQALRSLQSHVKQKTVNSLMLEARVGAWSNYDLTNTYMTGQAKFNSKAKHGVSKEKRYDCPLVTMGLVINEHGFLNRTSILPGNASEPKTLEDMLKNLSAHQSLLKPIIILDAGIATGSNLLVLKGNGYQYVVSARQEAPSIELEGEWVAVGDLKDLVNAALVKSSNGDEKWLYCESEAKAAVASSMKQSFRKRFEEALKKLSEELAKHKRRKKYTKVLEQIGRMKEKHKNISGCYEINAIPSEAGITAIAIDWKVNHEKMEEKLTGKYFLRTNIIENGKTLHYRSTTKVESNQMEIYSP